MKQQFLALFLLTCLSLPISVGYIWIQHQRTVVRREVKKQMIAGIDKEELVLLKFDKEQAKNQLHWKHSKEFEYNSEMYDVVKTIIEGDRITYYCWWDYKETSLNKQLDKLATKAFSTDARKNKKQKQVINFYNSFYYQVQSNWKSMILQNNQLDHDLELSYTSLYTSPPSPPPKFC